ncbi:MAG: hypothetical protein II723_06510, partial [Oscillospiraceae bacterium]|nr:hypothetical protein [Oscillospiraceae bacterium]
GDGGYVSYVTVGGKVRVKGNDFRYIMGLKSPKFEFVYQPGATAPKTATVTTEPASYSNPGATHASIAVKYTTTTTTATTAATTKSASTSSETSGKASTAKP